MAAVSAFILQADGNREGPSTRDLRAEVFTQPRPKPNLLEDKLRPSLAPSAVLSNGGRTSRHRWPPWAAGTASSNDVFQRQSLTNPLWSAVISCQRRPVNGKPTSEIGDARLDRSAMQRQSLRGHVFLFPCRGLHLPALRRRTAPHLRAIGSASPSPREAVRRRWRLRWSNLK